MRLSKARTSFPQRAAPASHEYDRNAIGYESAYVGDGAQPAHHDGHGLRERARESASQVTHKLSEVASSVSERVGEVAGSVSERVGGVAGSVNA